MFFAKKKSGGQAATMGSSRFKSILKEVHMARFIAKLEVRRARP